MDLKSIKLILNGPDYLHANPQWCREALSWSVDKIESLEKSCNTRIHMDALKCGVCGKKTALVCTECAKNNINDGHQ